MRKKGASTRYPGVQRLGEGTYRLRFKAKCPKTERIREIDRIIESCASVAEAARRRDELKAEIESAGRQAERVRLADYSRSWLRGKLPTLKASTRRHYAFVLETHVWPMLGDYYLDAVTQDDIIKWRDAQEGKPASINGRLRVLRTLFADASADPRLDLPRNPTMRVSALREIPAYDDDDPNTLTAAELGALLAAAKTIEPDRYAMFATLAYTGMRFGEATALKWADIDSNAGRIHIRRAQWQGRVDTTKTGKARTVPLAPELDEVLTEHRQALLARQAAGLDEGWVFPGPKGHLLRNTGSLHRQLQGCVVAAGIKRRFSVHGFRRTFNNLARQVAAGEVVRAMTGHVTEAMTAHYSHVDHDEKRAALLRVAGLITLRPLSSSQSGDSGGDATVSSETAGESSHSQPAVVTTVSV